MRTDFPGALHEVRSTARFPLGFEGVWIPKRASVSAATSGCAKGKRSHFIRVLTKS